MSRGRRCSEKVPQGRVSFPDASKRARSFLIDLELITDTARLLIPFSHFWLRFCDQQARVDVQL